LTQAVPDCAVSTFEARAHPAGLLAVASEPGPLLFIVDDAHWLDRSSARLLAFMARRLATEPGGVLFATRDPRGCKREQCQR
jgi:hypothetical protein